MYFNCCKPNKLKSAMSILVKQFTNFSLYLFTKPLILQWLTLHNMMTMDTFMPSCQSNEPNLISPYPKFVLTIQTSVTQLCKILSHCSNHYLHLQILLTPTSIALRSK